MLESFKKNGLLSSDCLIRKSFLEECRGERFEKILLHLSWILLKRMPGILSSQENDISIPCIQLKIIEIEKRFHEKMQRKTELKDSFNQMSAFIQEKRIELESKSMELKGNICMTDSERDLFVKEQTMLISRIESLSTQINSSLYNLNKGFFLSLQII